MSNFPMFRLLTLLARQLSTPIANYIRVYTRRHPRYSRAVCMGIGRSFHYAELRFRMWTLGLKRPRHLPPISDQNALDSGAYILGEVVLFGIGGLILVLEVNRQANKQEDKVLDEESQWLALLMSLEELQRELVLQQQDLDRLQAALGALLAPPAPSTAPEPAPPPASAPPSAAPASPPSRAPAPPLKDESRQPTQPAPPPEGDEDECSVEEEDLNPPSPLKAEPSMDPCAPHADLSPEPDDECTPSSDVSPPPPEEPC